MSIYERFCTCHEDENGALRKIEMHYADDFNFAYDVVDEIAKESPEKRAIVWCNANGEERTFTFSDVAKESNRYANALSSLGIGKGDFVMLCLKKHYEYWFISTALHKLGAVMVPVTHMLRADDFKYRFTAADIKAVITTYENDVPSRIKEALFEAKKSATLMSIREDVDGFVNLSKLKEDMSDTFSRIKTNVSDSMMMYFTSGTTGYPKGVIHDFSYPLAHIVTAKYWQRAEDGGLHFTVAETGWAKASWGKMYGQWLVGSAVMVYDFDNFDPKMLTQVINKYKVTSFCAPPTVYRYLVKKGAPEMPSLKSAATAGEYLNPEIFKKFYEKTGLYLNEGYGQTETTLLSANYKGIMNKEGSMGVKSPLYDLRLVDKSGKEVETGEIGEIVIVPENGKKPIGVFSSYLGDEELYKAAWEKGVYHTGDSAWKDEDGYFWFHGRFDDIIKSGGFRIGPFEIENILIKHDAVLECSVVGIPDPLRGQAIKAFIVLSHGYKPSSELEKEIREFTNSKLAEYKWIRYIEFTDELPKTISGKIRKKELKESY